MSTWHECPACGTAYDSAIQAARCCRGRGNVARTWRTSAACGANGTCVAVAAAPAGRLLIRDTADPAGPVLTVPRGVLAALRAVGLTCPNCQSTRSVRAASGGRWRCGCGHRWAGAR